MSLKEVIKKAEILRGSKVSTVKDCGDRWYLGFTGDVGKSGSAPMFAFKSSGRLEYFLIWEYADLLLQGKTIDIPK